MSPSKAAIIAQLQREIFPLQGFKRAVSNAALNTSFGHIKNAFPGNIFPLGAVHEFIAEKAEDAAVTGSFITSILAFLMINGGITLWIGPSRSIFPPALKSFGIAPDKIIFIDLHKEKEILWATEEALKCEGLAAVVSQIQEVSFTASRRLQLAVEQSRVTGFIVRQNPRSINITACISRWKITSLASDTTYEMPGVGFPCWNVELLKIRNGVPGNWKIECIAGRFRHINKVAAVPLLQKKKAG
ncbi:MAG: Error-prone repair protein ImuA [Ginsengibacter sp.]